MLAEELQSILQETGNQYRKHLFQKLPLSRVRATLTSRPTRPILSPKVLKANTWLKQSGTVATGQFYTHSQFFCCPLCRFILAHLNFWLSLHILHEHYVKGIERKEIV